MCLHLQSLGALSHTRTLSLSLGGQGSLSKGWIVSPGPLKTSFPLFCTSCAAKAPGISPGYLRLGLPGWQATDVQAAGSGWSPLYPTPIYTFSCGSARETQQPAMA